MSEFKYISFLVEMKQLKFRLPIIFPDKLVHKEVAEAISECIAKHFKGATVTAVNAGMIEDVTVANVYGESTTLGLRSRKDKDEEMINSYPYFHGVI